MMMTAAMTTTMEEMRKPNFTLPVELGQLNNELPCTPPCCVGTDLESIDKWTKFDEWVGFKLSLIDVHKLSAEVLPNYDELHSPITVENKQDLLEFLGCVFALAGHVLDAVDACFDEYRFVANPKNSYDYEFKRRDEHGLFVVEAECSKHWPQLGEAWPQQHAISVQHFERLYAYLVVNQMEYAVVTNWRHTRFVKLDGKRLLVSEPIAFDETEKHTVLGALVALILHTTDYKTVTPPSSIVEHSLEFDVWPYDDQYQEFENGAVTFKHGKYNKKLAYYTAQGEYQAACGSDMEPCVVKYQDVSKLQRDQLRWEALIYQRLEFLQGVVIPECLNYGTIWDCYSALVVQNCGRALQFEELAAIPNFEYKVISLVKILHMYNILLGDIRPGSFCRDETTGRVMIKNLHHCKFTAAVDRKLGELEQARNLVKRALTSNPKRRPLSWRQCKSRAAGRGWACYAKRFVTVKAGPFVRAVRVDGN